MKPATADFPRIPACMLARRLALSQIAAAGKACARIKRDAESLHQFRVALRRLRGVLRAYEAELGIAVKKKHLRRLQRICAVTGNARDAEVQLSWLKLNSSGLSRALRPGADWLREQVEASKAAAQRELNRNLIEKFRDLRRQLERALRARIDTTDQRGQCAPGPSAAILLGRLVRLHASALSACLAPLHSGPDQDQAHQARIACKRLRYLIEPFTHQAQAARNAAKALEQLQDLLGEMHDADMLAQRIDHELSAAELGHPLSFAARRGRPARNDPRIGMLEIRVRLLAQRAAARARLLKLWNRRNAPTFFNRIQEFARQIEAAGVSPIRSR